jgi:hypothetical protein
MKIGKRVRFAHTNSYGTVVGTEKAGADGAPRIPVKWDNSGLTTAWHPAFLFDEDSLEINDPDVVYGSNIKKSRPKTVVGKDGIITIEKGGFSEHKS